MLREDNVVNKSVRTHAVAIQLVLLSAFSSLPILV